MQISALSSMFLYLVVPLGPSTAPKSLGNVTGDEWARVSADLEEGLLGLEANLEEEGDPVCYGCHGHFSSRLTFGYSIWSDGLDSQFSVSRNVVG